MPEQTNAEQSQPVETQHILANTAPKEDPVTTHERAMFTKGVQDSGKQIPSNFKSSDDWFNSLLEARKGFTQARQEIADLKKQYNNNGVTNPNYQDSPVAQTEKVVEADISGIPEDLSGIPESLRIAPPPEKPKITLQEDWSKWHQEIDSSGGLSATARKEMQDKTGKTARQIDQEVNGRVAMKKQGWEEAASLVGGSDNLKRMYKWAQENLTPEEVAATNHALQTNAYKNVLFGLKSRYEQQNPAKPQSQEPKALQNRVNPSQVPQSVQVFNSFAEQQAALRDPRFRTDANFRNAVQSMVVNSSQHGYKNR